MPLLQVQELWKSYGRKEVLRGVDLTLEDGELVAVLGPNGAGKTTLIRVICTLTSADSGTVMIEGKDVAEEPLEARKKIGAVMHASLLYDDLSVIENLRFFHVMAGLSRSDFDEKAAVMLEKLGLGLRKNDRVATLSMGMKRRLSIARALITSPKLLIMDEPFSGLDLKSQDIISVILEQEMRKCGGGLMVTHDLSAAASIANRSIVLNEGRVVASFTGEEMRSTDFKDRYNQSLKGAEE